MDASSAAAQYQTTGNSGAQTGNPQNISSSSLQPQASSLQDAAQQTSDAVKLLDQGNGTIRVNGVPVSSTGSSTTPASISSPTNSSHTYVYAGLGLVIVVFMFGMYRGLMRDPK